MIDAIDEARFDAAQKEHERMQRQARVAATKIRGVIGRLRGWLLPANRPLTHPFDEALSTDLGELEGVAEHLEKGDWILAPLEAAQLKEAS